MGGLSLRELGGKLWQSMDADDVFGRAGQLAYAFFFAIFPLGISLTALVGVALGRHSAVQQHLVASATRAMPPAAAQLVQQTMQTAVNASGGGKLTFGILVSLFAASSGMSAMMDTLNVVFGVKEGRSLLRQRWIDLWLTIVVGFLLCVGVALIVAANAVSATAWGPIVWVWRIFPQAGVVFVVLLSYSLIYYYAPNVKHPEWHWVTPGAVIGMGLWILVSIALQLYLKFFNSYSVTYGALGAVMILMLWFYVSGLAVLIGGEINAIIQRAGVGRVKQEEPPEHVSASAIERQKTQRQKMDEAAPKQRIA